MRDEELLRWPGSWTSCNHHMAITDTRKPRFVISSTSSSSIKHNLNLTRSHFSDVKIYREIFLFWFLLWFPKCIGIYKTSNRRWKMCTIFVNIKKKFVSCLITELENYFRLCLEWFCPESNYHRWRTKD